MMQPEEPSHPQICQVCGDDQANTLQPAMLVRPAVAQLILEETGKWDDQGWICGDDLQRFRRRYVEVLLQDEKGEITQLEAEVLESMHKHEILTSNPDAEFESDLTVGQRLADKIATFGGSWTFILLFGLFLFLWMTANSILLFRQPFDPYPFILLNLVLSSLAAIQAPLIMMSQNRQEARDRLRATHDYQINLKAELEIRQLHQKIDHVLSHQWHRLVEIQNIQLELINELRAAKS